MMRTFVGLLAALGSAMIAATPGAYAAAAAGAPASPSGAEPTSGAAASPKSAQSAGATASDHRVFYALGVLLSHNQNLAALDLSDQELKQVLAGFRDGYQHHAQIADPDSYLPQVQELQRSREQAVADRQKRAGAAYTATAAALPGAQKTASGLVYIPSVQGHGAQPGPTDRVKVQYAGKLIDGSEFDSSYKRGQPATFPLAGIIPCWKEALQLMKVGGHARVVCPSDLAYGDRGRPPVIPPGATLDFQIELLDVVAPPAPAMAVPNTPAPAHSALPHSGASGSSPPPR
jgi:FKBP-type peptidyl-prolyl cis-trans isomerase